MVRPKKIFAFVLLLSICVSPRVLFAQDILYVAGASIGFNEFEFTEKLDTPITHLMAEVAINAIYERFIVTLSAAQAIDKADVSEEDETGKADRSDYDFLIGYQLNPDWTLFGGYKNGETSIDFIDRETSIRETDRYKQSGPYLGVSYGYRLQRSGKLGFSIAYAYLDSDNVFNAGARDEDDEDVEFDDLDGNQSGKTEGFSFVASWSMPLSPELIYQTRLRYNDYEQNLSGRFDGQSFDFDVPESHLMLMMGLNMVF